MLISTDVIVFTERRKAEINKSASKKIILINVCKGRPNLHPIAIMHLLTKENYFPSLQNTFN